MKSNFIFAIWEQGRTHMGYLATIQSIFIARHLQIRFVLLTASLFFAQLLTAQVKFSTIANSHEIGRGDYVQVEFVVENAKVIDHLQPPSFSEFHVVQGPIQSSGMSIINGDMSQYKSLSFVLQPVKTGKFTIAGATATVDGKTMHSNPVTIEVNNGTSSNNNPPATIQPVWPGESMDMDREYILRPGENIDEKIRKNLFVKLQVSKTSCYVGEPIVATYKLYSRLQSESRVTKHPSLNGFSVYDMIEPNGDAVSVETVNGKPFTVHTIRKAQLIPLQSGTVELDPVEIENTVHFVKSSQRRHEQNTLQDLFDQFAEEANPGVPVEKNITLDSKPVAITVKPLPEESKPVSFNGAVGHFAMEAGIENKNARAQDAAILKVTVKGAGNLPVVNAPFVKWPSGVESYDAAVKDNIDKTIAPLSGTKTFEYSFIPKIKGRYDIPAIEFSYFDPASSSYKTLLSKPLSIEVAPAQKNSPQGLANKVPAGEKGSSGEAGSFLRQHPEWIFIVLILSGLAAYLWKQNLRLRKARKADEMPGPDPAKAGEPVPEAPVVDPLQKSRELLETADYKGFYAELNAVVWEAVAGKLQLPSSALNKHNITQALNARGWSAETTQSLRNILNECEMSLYTPDYNFHDMQQLLKQTAALLDQLA
jgi:hypothetical protein